MLTPELEQGAVAETASVQPPAPDDDTEQGHEGLAEAGNVAQATTGAATTTAATSSTTTASEHVAADVAHGTDHEAAEASVAGAGEADTEQQYQEEDQEQSLEEMVDTTVVMQQSGYATDVVAIKDIHGNVHCTTFHVRIHLRNIRRMHWLAFLCVVCNALHCMWLDEFDH